MQKVAIAALLLVAACSGKERSMKQLRSIGRPEPINCVYADSRAGAYVCTDGASWTWQCDEEGCINTWRPR